MTSKRTANTGDCVPIEALEARQLLTSMMALAQDNLLLSFDSAAPAIITGGLAITGLPAGEQIVGIDFRPLNDTLLGLSAGGAGGTNRLYTIDPNTGAATLIGLTATLANTGVAFDVNPVVDRIRLIDAAGNNSRINPVNGTLVSPDLAVGGGARIVGAAYTNNFAGATSTVLYGIDDLNDQLVAITPPNNGTVVNIGSLGFNVVASGGFDIDASGNAWASLKAAGGSNTFGSINLTTGAFTAIGTIAGSTTLTIIGLAARPIRSAPAITGGLTPLVSSVNEDSTGDAGTTISALIASPGGNLITNTSLGAREGVAIVGADTAHGTWQYSLNGTTWNALTNVFGFHALLLPADGTARVRFIPTADFNGTITSALTFRAWDLTSGTAGQRADTTSNGGTTAFSATSVGASITVAAVYDAPRFGGSPMKFGELPDNQTAVPFEGQTVVYTDSASQALAITVTISPATIGVFTPASLTASGFVAQVTPGQYLFTGNASAATAAIGALVLDPADNLFAAGTFTETTVAAVIDDGVGPDVLGSSTFINVVAANDAPTISGLTPSNTLGLNSNVRPFRRMRVADVDPSESITTTVVLDKPLKGKFTTESLTASGFMRVGRGRFQFVGGAAAATVAIRKLRFQFNNNLAAGVVHRVRFTITAADVGGLTATNNVTTVTLA